MDDLREILKYQYIYLKKITVKRHGGIWYPSKKLEKVKQKYQNQSCQNYLKRDKNTRVYCNCSKGVFLLYGLFSDRKVERVMNF